MPSSSFVGCVASPVSSFLLIKKGSDFSSADGFTLLASFCFLTVFFFFFFFPFTLLSFGLSTVIQNVTHRASTKSPDKTPYGGTILGESALKSTSTLNKSGSCFDNKAVIEFCTVCRSAKSMLVHFLSLFSILACVHSRLGSSSVRETTPACTYWLPSYLPTCCYCERVFVILKNSLISYY